jgi:hypothetical protein
MDGLIVPGEPGIGAPGLAAPGVVAIGLTGLTSPAAETSLHAVTYQAAPVAYQSAPITYG